MKTLLLAIPTYNEALVIETNLRKAHSLLSDLLKDFGWTLLVADNGSTDETSAIVERLKGELPRLALWHTDKKGRGNALRHVWQEFDADVYAYMDADLATDLSELPKLLRELEHADLAIGSRLSMTSHTDRSFFREVVSRGYNILSRVLVGTKIKDLQCGFKAIKADVAKQILPLCTHDGWFFDTELIVLAEHHGFKVAELPVTWHEAPDRRRKSSVKVFQTAWDDFVNLLRLKRRLH